MADGFFGQNMVGQEQWARRGENDPRIRALEVTHLRLFGAGSAMLAGVPPAVDNNSIPFKIQVGTSVISYATGGNTITYPTAFPNGVFGTIITNGDDFAAIWTSVGASQTLSGFKVKAYDVSTTAVEHTAGTLLRLNWIAFGW